LNGPTGIAAVSTVPEPGSFTLVALALVGCGYRRWRKRPLQSL
jgi:hypothetical protein